MTSTEKRLLIAYDVTDDLRRARLAKLLESYGDRIQYSVFLIDLTAAQEVRLRRKVALEVDLRDDSVLFCVVGAASEGRYKRLTFLGRRRATPDEVDFIV